MNILLENVATLLLRALVGMTIPMGYPVCKAVDNLICGDIGKEVGSPDGSLVVGEYVGVSVIGVFVIFFGLGALVGSFV